ncbi:isocitrate lyase/PEP mutase family protein [Natribacillus halophilus]|uniref:Carboxyvinyl-carboxyphosphonate phosphorylmutase n=1 Tax=Natribacillus halophilus TaxID=549003 RepID=A0A1G8KHV6_9BACI|nr:isocitrate lyase/phosphoenolpyruvate mutase family protein [Natribacillus halophilus]SDI42984.1 carboxyvinyl-carboxyphosphonate phosphorylmutase [Natribacillus halophilus]
MKHFKDVLKDKKFTILPGVYDALSSKLAEEAGAKAIFISGGALSITNLAKPDMGFLTLDDFMDAINKIKRVVKVPIITDVDNGFGNAIHAANTAQSVFKAGADGLQIDDQVLPQTKPTTSKEAIAMDLVIPKIKAMRENVDESFTIIFRTVANYNGDVKEAVDRVNLAGENGADVVYVDGLSTYEEVLYVADNVKYPLLLNMNEKGFPATLEITEVKKLGFNIGLYPVSTMAITANATKRLLDTLMKDETTLKLRDEMMNPADIYNLFGLQSSVENESKKYE